MKRVLTLATAGVFSLGLVLLPMAGNAAETAATGGKDGKPVAATTTAPAPHSTATTAAPVKKDDKVTVAPTGGGNGAGAATAKPPVKTGS